MEEVDGRKRRPSREEERPADLRLIADSFSRCSSSTEGGVRTDHYLCALNELIRLFRQLRGGTDLALRGIDEAVKALEIRRVSGAGCHYHNIPWLLEHEDKQGVAWRRGSIPSGTSAVYDLQTALHFMVAFLTGISEACRNGRHWDAAARMKVYDTTIGKQHSLFKQAAIKASLALGAGRRQVMKNLTSSFHGDQSIAGQMENILRSAKPVQDQVDGILIKYLQNFQNA